MNAHGQPHLQGPFQGGMPPQQQNTGARMNTPQTAAKQPNNQGPRVQYGLAPEHLLDPQLSLWTLTKPPQGMSWEECAPEQLCVSKQDVEHRMAKFRRKGDDVTEILMRIKSASARKAINNLVVEQNENLWVHNPTIRYYIASIQLDMEVIMHWPDKGKKRLRRIDVILHTEPRPLHEIPEAYLEAMQRPKSKDPSSQQGGPGQHGNQGQKVSQPQGQGGAPGQYNNMQPQGNRPPQGQGSGNGQYQNQSQGQYSQGHAQPQNQNYGQPNGQNNTQAAGPGGIPPPPPQPRAGPASQGPGGAIPPPPPPPNGPPRQPQQANMQPNYQNIPPPPPPPNGPQRQPQQANMQPNMPQNIPPPPPPPAGPPRQPQVVQPQVPPPMPGAYPGTNPQPRIDVIDPRVLDAQKAKPKGPRRNMRDYSDSDTESFSDISIEGGFGYVERSRSRGSRDDHRRRRSPSLPRSRSRGRDGIFKSHKGKRAHGRRGSDIESPPRERYNTPPNASNPAMPHQNIFHIKIDNDKDRAKTKERDGHRRTRDQRRPNHSASPPGFPPTSYRAQDKYAAEAMYRSSSNNGTDSDSGDSYSSSSLYTPSDPSVFEEPDRHGKPVPIRTSYMPHRDDAFADPTNLDYERRASARKYYPGVNDYPSPRRPQFDDHIIPPTSPRARPSQAYRRSGAQNPFEYNPRYAAWDSTYAHDQPLPRYAKREHDQGALDELADVVLEKMQQQQRRPGNFGRRGGTRVPFGGLGMAADTDEWSSRPRHGGYRHVD